MTLGDRLWRSALVLADASAGRVSGRVRAVCQYGIRLIDSGGRQEFNALVRHRFRRALAGGRAPTARERSGPAIAIDARTERLTPDGTIAPKPTLQFPSEAAPLLASVIIPCYNYGAYIADAVASALAQTLGAVEVIVVDDGSNDAATTAAIDRLAHETPIRVIRQENRGLSAARNRGIEAARGEYICCLDADDALEPTYLEQTIAILEADRAAGFAYSWVQHFGDDASIWETEDFDPERALIGNFTAVAAVFRRDDWQLAGGYSSAMAGGFEDWEFWIRLACLGRRGRTIARPLFRHRRHGRTMTHTAKAQELDLRARMRSLCPGFYEDAAQRRRIARMTASRDDRTPFTTLTGAQKARGVNTPGLLVVVTGLLRGGAHSMLRDVLDSLRGAWHAVIVTTGDMPQPLEDAFASITPDIFHLHGFLEQTDWPAFVDYVIASRHVTTVLSSDCLWWLDRVDTVRRTHPQLRLIDVIHNHVPTSTFRSSIAHSRSIDRHIAVSTAITTALTQAGVPAARIAEIPNGVDTTLFDAARLNRDKARRSFGVVDADTVLLAWAGRLSEEKRPTLFVELVAALTRRMAVRGIMIGDGPEAARVSQASGRLNLQSDFERRGSVPRADLAALYAAADLFVLTSRVEGMPLVVLEALAAGCPVASTDVGDVSRVVRHGTNGFLVGVNDVPALADAIASWSRDAVARAAMRDAAAATIREGPYQLTDMCAAYARVLGHPQDPNGG